MRESCLDVIHKLYPGIEPRHDFDISFLSTGQYHGPLTNEAVYAWMDDLLDEEADIWPKGLSKSEGRSCSIEYARKALDLLSRITVVR